MRALGFVILASIAIGGCASASGAVPRPFPLPGGGNWPSPATSGSSLPGTTTAASLPSGPAGTADGYSISSTALLLRGAPYRNGGADPQGFDCSGFVQYVFAQHGVRMPRDTRQQFDLGGDVDASQLEPGDLVFFTTVGPGASHVGIVIGGDQFIHAPSTSGVVRVENLSMPYWASRFVGAKRVN